MEGACPVISYNVYYREVISKAKKSSWNMVTVNRNATSFTLQLNCRKKYEVAVTSLNTYGESDFNDSRIWHLNTQGGNVVLSADSAWVVKWETGFLRLFSKKPRQGVPSIISGSLKRLVGLAHKVSFKAQHDLIKLQAPYTRYFYVIFSSRSLLVVKGCPIYL